MLKRVNNFERKPLEMETLAKQTLLDRLYLLNLESVTYFTGSIQPVFTVTGKLSVYLGFR